MSHFLAPYEAFVRKATDTPHEFGHAAGLTCLSTIALGRRHVPKGNKIKPNLYLMLTAGSSKARKSTNVQHVKKMIAAVEGDRLGPEDFTAEGLVFYMREKKSGKSKSRLLLPIEEFGSILASTKSYSANLSPILCKLYDGEDYERVRSGKKPLRVAKPRLTIFGGVAYGMLEKFMDPTDWVTGFYARFLFVEPKTFPPPYPSSPAFPKTEFDQAKTELLALKMALAARTGPQQVDPQAEAVHAQYASTFPDDYGDPVIDAQRERYLNTLWKLALLYQLDEKESDPIGLVAMNKAIAFGQKTWESFLNIYTNTSGSHLGRLVKKIWQRIDAAGQEGVSKRQIMREFHMNNDSTLAVFDILAKNGVIRVLEGIKGAKKCVSLSKWTDKD
jgi:hypothetical protein